MVNCTRLSKPRKHPNAYKTSFKQNVNNLIPKFLLNHNSSLKNIKSVIVDHSNLGTSRHLIKNHIKPKNIIVINNDAKCCKQMRTQQLDVRIANIDAIDIGKKIKSNVDFLYLDVNGTPKSNTIYMTNAIKSDIISLNSLVGITFSKRVGSGNKYSIKLRTFKTQMIKTLKSKGLKIGTQYDSHIYKDLSYGGGKGNKQSAMETFFYHIEQL